MSDDDLRKTVRDLTRAIQEMHEANTSAFKRTIAELMKLNYRLESAERRLAVLETRMGPLS